MFNKLALSQLALKAGDEKKVQIDKAFVELADSDCIFMIL